MLDKPYSFYDWVTKAEQEIAARGEKPIQLSTRPGGAEIAKARWVKDKWIALRCRHTHTTSSGVTVTCLLLNQARHWRLSPRGCVVVRVRGPFGRRSAGSSPLSPPHWRVAPRNPNSSLASCCALPTATAATRHTQGGPAHCPPAQDPRAVLAKNQDHDFCTLSRQVSSHRWSERPHHREPSLAGFDLFNPLFAPRGNSLPWWGLVQLTEDADEPFHQFFAVV
jgi:hypothetical protein